jgi:putative colanic acid biosynthesis acetyltransferase WcaF
MKKKLSPKFITFENQFYRLLWDMTWLIFYRPSPRKFHFWRCFLLRLFGAKIGVNVHPYPSSKVWAPWNLTIGSNSCLSHNVNCYNVDKIVIGSNVTISQYSFICTASHNYTNIDMQLVTAPIQIKDYVWITSDVFIAPGVTIGEGTVVVARSSVFNDLPNWIVARGNPAVFLKNRQFLNNL